MPRTPTVRAEGVGRRLLRSVGFGLAFTLPVAAAAFLVRSNWTPILRADELIIEAATTFTRGRPGLRDALVVWQEMLQPRWVYIAGTLVCIWVWRRFGLTERALWAFVTMMVSWNIALDIKLLVQRGRPVVPDALATAPGYSFPSGHAANAAAASTILVVLLWPVLGRRGRAVAVVTAATVTLVTAADRVLLGVHYPSDVTAGIVLGVGMGMASYAGWRPRLPDGWTPAHTRVATRASPTAPVPDA